ncbi:MAG: tryptophan--tRNA ligase [Myxococcales bacterium]
MGKKRVVSGMRPTGRLHLGNLHGALTRWIELQDEYESFFFSADWHALTTGYQSTEAIRQDERDMFADWLAAGLDPARCTLFVQSAVLEHAELYLLLGMVTPTPWLERVPTYKEQQQELRDRDLTTYGFLGYPLLQTADIAAYRAAFVPVGQDQLAHLELSREIVRRFNHLFPEGGGVLVEPQPLLAEVPKVWGTDGRKMSKSYGNTILLGEEEEPTRKKIMGATTDPARVRRQDKGNPENCGIFYLHKLYSTPARVQEVDAGCRSAGIGCVDCKKWLLEGLLPAQAKLRESRLRVLQEPERIDAAVTAGTARAREVAGETLEAVRRAMHLSPTYGAP